MVRDILSRANSKITVGKAAALLSATYFLSNLLGLFRERLLASKFGLGDTLDAYISAFSLIDLIYYLLVSGALSVVLVPLISDLMDKNSRNKIWEFTSSTFNFLSIVTFFFGLVFLLFPEQLISIAFRGFDPDGYRFQVAVDVLRILAFNPLLFSMSSVLASIQQAYGRFFFFALAPITYNIGIIFGIIYLSPTFSIYGVAYGAVIGAMLQLAVQTLGLAGLGFKQFPRINFKDQSFRKFLRLLVPRSLDQGVDQLNSVVERGIASFLASGAIASYQYAYTLKNVPVTLIGVAIATAAFPSISKRALSARRDLLQRDLSKAIRAILYLALPSAAIAIIMRGYITRLLLGFGSPTVASILGWLSVAIVFQALLQLVTRVFYAHKNTKTPLYISIVAIIVNIIFALLFVKAFGIRGLAMAQSLVAILETMVLAVILHKDTVNLFNKDILSGGAKMTIAAFLMAIINYGLVRTFPLFLRDEGFFTLAPKFGLIVVVSLISYILIGYLMNIKESKIVFEKSRNIVMGRVTIK